MSHTTPRHHRRSLHAFLDMITHHGLPGKVNSTVCHALQQAAPLTVKSALEQSLEEE